MLTSKGYSVRVHARVYSRLIITDTVGSFVQVACGTRHCCGVSEPCADASDPCEVLCVLLSLCVCVCRMRLFTFVIRWYAGEEMMLVRYGDSEVKEVWRIPSLRRQRSPEM